MLYILILVALFIVFYFMPILLIIEAKRDDQDDAVSIRLHTFYGLLKLKTEVPFINLTIENNKLVVKYKARIKSGKTSRFKRYFNKMMTTGEMKGVWSFFRGGFRYKKPFLYLLSRTRVKRLRFNLSLGAGDAALTGVLTGISRIVLGMLLSLLFNFVNATAESIAVSPVFDKSVFKLELGCIIHVKLGHIISTGIRMLIVSMDNNS